MQQKRGTTFLQKKVFSNIEGIFCAYQGDAFFLDRLQDLQWINNYEPGEKLYNKKYLTKYNLELSQLFYGYDDILLSHEGFIGDGRTGHENKHHSLNVFKTLFPTAKIFISIRKQDDWLYSYHNEFTIKARGFKKKQSFKQFCKLNICWHELCQMYITAFGARNVLVLPYELLRDNPKFYINQLHSFFQFKHKFFPQEYDRVNVRKKKSWWHLWYSNDLSHKDREEILLRHRESNYLLADLIGVDLERYGY